MTRRTPNRYLVPHEVLNLHPDDLARLGLRYCEATEVTSRRGSVLVRVHATGAGPPEVDPVGW
jgi:anaerobic selenocysteine-containing dehydrogenase